MSRIAKFLGKDLTEEQLTLLKEKTSFESMKKMQEKGSDEMAQFRKSMNLVRKGNFPSMRRDIYSVQHFFHSCPQSVISLAYGCLYQCTVIENFFCPRVLYLPRHNVCAASRHYEKVSS